MRWCSTGVFSDGCDNAKLLSSLCRKLPNLTVQVETFAHLNFVARAINAKSWCTRLTQTAKRYGPNRFRSKSFLFLRGNEEIVLVISRSEACD
jgi:hypothetical protein